MRIEDTDQNRSTEESYHQVLESMRWLGLEWDEGPELEPEGNYGPYRQSLRLETYKEHAQKLLDTKKAFRCFCTQEELERKKAQREAMGLPNVYDGKCKSLTEQEISNKLASNQPYTIRFLSQDTEVIVQDMVQGTVRFDTSLIGDFIIVKSDGFPSYNFAVVVDDHLMEISHVIRGVGHLSNTPRQILIYKALEWSQPAWAHVSEIVGSDHKKLSKRHGATSITAFRDLGYLASAFVNYMALLGWSTPDGEEYKPFHEIKSIFDVSRCNKSPSMFDVFDIEKAQETDLNGLSANDLQKFLLPKSKLNWISNHHIRAMDEKKYLQEILPFVAQSNLLASSESHLDNERLVSILKSLRVYLDYFSQIADLLPGFYMPFNPQNIIDTLALEFTKNEFFLSVTAEFLRQIEKYIGEPSELEYKEIMKVTGKNVGAKGKNLFMNLRVAITGSSQGLELPVYCTLLGKAENQHRLRTTLDHFSQEKK